MQELARSVPGVLDVHDVRAEHIGPGVIHHAGMHITVPRSLSIGEADGIAREVDRRIHEGAPEGFCVIHVDPAMEAPQPDPVTAPMLSRASYRGSRGPWPVPSADPLDVLVGAGLVLALARATTRGREPSNGLAPNRFSPSLKKAFLVVPDNIFGTRT
jgi:hypothetical protein